MAQYEVLKLNFNSPLHIGTGRETYDSMMSQLHSDTLSGAIASTWCKLFGADDLDAFMQSYTLSSCFPFKADSYFLPKPQGRISVTFSDLEEYSSRKKIKKIQYIELPLWEKLINGEGLSCKSCQLVGEGFLATEATVANWKHDSKLYVKEVQQRVTVPNDCSEDPKPYYFERLFFAEDAGLFCLVQVDPSWKKRFRQVVEVLGDSGVGTDKNVGNGMFVLDVDSVNMSLPEKEDRVMLLSLFTPSEDELNEMNLDGSIYSLVERGGFMAGSSYDQFAHLRRRSIYAFTVGSILACEHIAGRIVDLAPTWNDDRMHRVLRDFRAFSVPVKNCESCL